MKLPPDYPLPDLNEHVRPSALPAVLGLGETKRQRYGDALLALVRQWSLESGEA